MFRWFWRLLFPIRKPTTNELMREAVSHLINHGIDSLELEQLVEKHKDNLEFVNLVRTAKRLRRGAGAKKKV